LNFILFFSHRIYGAFNLSQKIYVVTDPEVIKRICIKDFDHFVNHNEMLSNFDRIFGKSLFGLLGQKWRDMRATLSPMFTGSKMKSTFGLLSAHANDFITHFEKKAGKDESKDVDVLEVFSRFTVDAIATAALGFEGDCVANDDSKLFVFAKNMTELFTSSSAIFKFTFGTLFPKLYKFFELQLTSKETYDFFRRTIVDVMNERDRTNTSRQDIIQLMLNVKKGQLNDEVKDVDSNKVNYKSNAKNLAEIIADDEYWMAQGFIFFFAGFDTTSQFLQSVTLELALNPEVQEELHREISEVTQSLDGEPVSYEALQKMKFLDMRKHPPAPQIDRHCTKDYELDLGNGKFVSIKKDDLVFLPYYQLHRDPEYFPNPEKFDPYRFSDENKDSIVSGTYLPFGIGPRACIGK